MSEHSITLNEAQTMVHLYRENRDSILKEEYQGLDILSISETFAKEEFLEMLSDNSVKYLRLYFGMDENLKVHAIFTGADENGKDILPDTETPDALILERGKVCPTNCPPESALYP